MNKKMILVMTAFAVLLTVITAPTFAIQYQYVGNNFITTILSQLQNLFATVSSSYILLHTGDTRSEAGGCPVTYIDSSGTSWTVVQCSFSSTVNGAYFGQTGLCGPLGGQSFSCTVSCQSSAPSDCLYQEVITYKETTTATTTTSTTMYNPANCVTNPSSCPSTNGQLSISISPSSIPTDGVSTAKITVSVSPSISGIQIYIPKYNFVGTLSNNPCTTDSTGKCTIILTAPYTCSNTVGSCNSIFTATANGYGSASANFVYSSLPVNSISANSPINDPNCVPSGFNNLFSSGTNFFLNGNSVSQTQLINRVSSSCRVSCQSYNNAQFFHAIGVDKNSNTVYTFAGSSTLGVFVGGLPAIVYDLTSGTSVQNVYMGFWCANSDGTIPQTQDNLFINQTQTATGLPCTQLNCTVTNSSSTNLFGVPTNSGLFSGGTYTLIIIFILAIVFLGSRGGGGVTIINR